MGKGGLDGLVQARERDAVGAELSRVGRGELVTRGLECLNLWFGQAAVAVPGETAVSAAAQGHADLPTHLLGPALRVPESALRTTAAVGEGDHRHGDRSHGARCDEQG
jgi:hypothetical protein